MSMKQPLQELLHPEWNEPIVIDIGEPIVFDDLIVSDLEWNNVIDNLSFDGREVFEAYKKADFNSIELSKDDS